MEKQIKKLHPLHTRVDAILFSAIQDYCYRNDVTMSTALRWMIRDYMERNNYIKSEGGIYK